MRRQPCTQRFGMADTLPAADLAARCPLGAG